MEQSGQTESTIKGARRQENEQNNDAAANGTGAAGEKKASGTGRNAVTRSAAYPDQPAGLRRNAVRNDDVINLLDLFYLFLDHIWQIILCMILGAGLTFSYTYFLVDPLYEASSKIYIVSASNNSVVNLSDLQIGESLTNDYEELLLIRPLLQDVISNLGLDMSYTTLENMISITNEEDTRILTITVTSTDPVQAADIANELVTQAIIYLPQIMESDEPNLVEEAIVPTSKSSPSYSRNTVMGALIGFVLCYGILVVRYLMDDTLATQDDVEKYFGVMPLAVIPEGESGEIHRKGRHKHRKNRKGEYKA